MPRCPKCGLILPDSVSASVHCEGKTENQAVALVIRRDKATKLKQAQKAESQAAAEAADLEALEVGPAGQDNEQ